MARSTFPHIPDRRSLRIGSETTQADVPRSSPAHRGRSRKLTLPLSSTNPAALVYQPKADGRGAAEDCEFGPDRLEDERIRIHVSPGVGLLGRRGVSRGWTGAVEPRAFAATLASARYWPSVMVRRLLPSVSEIIQVQGRPMTGLLIYLILRDYRNPDAS